MAVKPWGVKDTDDIFGILALTKTGGGTLADVLKIKVANRDTLALSVSTTPDEFGDVADKNLYGAPNTMFDVTQDFEVIGDFVLSDLFIGETSTTGTCIGGVSPKTSNTGWPTLSFTGVVGKAMQDRGDGSINKWYLPAITIKGLEVAQDFGGGAAAGLGFTKPTGTKITGSSLNFTATIDETTDGVGVPCAFAIRGIDGTMSADFVLVDELTGFCPAVTVDTATGYLWKVLKQPNTAKSGPENWTGSFEATIASPATSLTRETA